MTTEEKLVYAAALIEEVSHTLDTSGSECRTCKRMHRTNFTEYQTGIELTAMVRKLRRYAGQLRGDRRNEVENPVD